MHSLESVNARVDELIADGRSIEATKRGTSYEEWVDSARHRGWYIQTLVFLSNILGENHLYTQEWKNYPPKADAPNTRIRVEILRRLKHDLQRGLLRSLEEIVHADLFDDYLEMASHLLSRGYKDAAAVIAGSTCEAHLRKLCDKHGIVTMKPTSNGKTEPKKASILNDDLKTQGVYAQPQWRQIQTWLDIRNDAAHGNYDQYTGTQVQSMIDGLRSFLIAHPA